jgi:phosphoenolpyruvate-protein phosphotransferase
MGERRLQGIAASEGIAIGPTFRYKPAELAVPERPQGPPQLEWDRFVASVERVRAQLADLAAQVEARSDPKTADIFRAQSAMVQDPMLHEAVRTRIEAGSPVEAAVIEASGELAGMLERMQDAMFSERSRDVTDVGRQLLHALGGMAEDPSARPQVPSIIVASDLAPSDTARLDPDLVLGLCTAAGGQTSHTAILARTLGLPAVVGLGEAALQAIGDGTPVALNGFDGRVIIHPSRNSRRLLEGVQQRSSARRSAALAGAKEAACTLQGRRIRVGANIGDLDSAGQVLELGGEEVGLLRTEFLYLDRSQPPSEDEQVEIYRSILELLEGRPVVVRTLDLGGDKPPSYLEFPQELNPFLGWRGVRIYREHETLLLSQLRAVLKAAAGHRVSVMYPMLTTLAELAHANELLERARSGLAEQGVPHATEMPVGIMLETPAACLLAGEFALQVDFFSLGTNDLTQYTLAVDRNNPLVAPLYQPLNPAVLRLVAQSIEAAHAHGKWVGMCGELASSPLAIPILVGLGLDEFSMVPRAIPEAKWLIRQLGDEPTRALARAALRCADEQQVEELAAEFSRGLG